MSRAVGDDPAATDGEGLLTMTAEEFWAEADFLGQALADQLGGWAELGAGSVARSTWPGESDLKVSPSKSEKMDSERIPSGRIKAGGSSGPSLVRSDSWPEAAVDLEALAGAAADCRLCALAECRSGVVGGRGSAVRPLIVLVVSSPAALAEPSGAEGKLMDGIIAKGLKLAPEDYHLTAAVNCLTPADRPQSRDQALACKAILTRELQLLGPKIVLAFGALAAQILSGQDRPLGLLRPRTQSIPGLPDVYLRVTFDLAEMLESPELKRETWKDIQKIIPVIDRLKKGLSKQNRNVLVCAK